MHIVSSFYPDERRTNDPHCVELRVYLTVPNHYKPDVEGIHVMIWQRSGIFDDCYQLKNWEWM